ncbi:hypothetical protein CPB83DRAFT_640939 [Crepidotus variabilis]|uniref:Uncharacterized protein n=1 Tax=Crepidotus variabilis TaxID=179855 RepID=A0A9P6JKM0_9AGAR|nr:hypothetical protein CPB83DRAFT_640939 [Crepidotus variabilis]
MRLPGKIQPIPWIKLLISYICVCCVLLIVPSLQSLSSPPSSYASRFAENSKVADPTWIQLNKLLRLNKCSVSYFGLFQVYARNFDHNL